MKYFILFILSVMLCGCSEKDAYFADKYVDEDFSIMLGLDVFVRSYPNAYNDVYVVFVSDTENAPTDGPFIVEFDAKTKEVSSTSSKLVENKSAIDEVRLKSAAMRLMDYGVCHLSIKKNGNAFVWIDNSSGKADLVKLGEGNSIEDLEGRWINSTGKWYRRK